MLKGKNLIVSRDGYTIGASKSCSVEVSASTIGVSGPTSGQWEDSIAGRKGWRVTTSHLLPNVMVNFQKVEISSGSWLSPGITVRWRGSTLTFGSAGRGLYLIRLHQNNGGMWLYENTRYDTFQDDAAITSMISALETGWPAGDVIMIGSVDAWRITTELRTKISTVLHIPLNQVPLASDPTWSATTLIGGTATNSKGIGATSEGRGNASHISAYYDDSSSILVSIGDTVKNFLMSAGQRVKLSLVVDGFGTDAVSGYALCTDVKLTGTNGSLLNGGFTFRGCGELG